MKLFWRCLAVACIGAGLSTPASAATVATFTLVDVNLYSGTATGSFDFNLDTGALSNVTVTVDEGVWANYSTITFNQAFVNALPDPSLARSVSNTLFSAVPPAFSFKFLDYLHTDTLFLTLGQNYATELLQPLSTANVFPGAAFLLFLDSSFAIETGLGPIPPPRTDSVSGGSLYVSAVTTTPVPAALPLFATGLAGLGWLARRRRK